MLSRSEDQCLEEMETARQTHMQVIKISDVWNLLQNQLASVGRGADISESQMVCHCISYLKSCVHLSIAHILFGIHRRLVKNHLLMTQIRSLECDINFHLDSLSILIK